jgi:hypothetical protein
VLLLDEPTNDLDVETLGRAGRRDRELRRLRRGHQHDRFFLDRLATHILAFEGNSHVEWFEGNFAVNMYEEDKRRRLGDAADRADAPGLQEADAVWLKQRLYSARSQILSDCLISTETAIR